MSVRRRRRGVLGVLVGLALLIGGAPVGTADELDPYLGDPGSTYPDVSPYVDGVYIDRPFVFDQPTGEFRPGPPVIFFDTYARNLGSVPLELMADEPTSAGTTPVSQCTSWRAPYVCRDRTTVGGFEWHDEHDHFHYNGFASYELRHRDPDGSPNYSPSGLIDISDKVSFCLMDSTQTEGAESQAPAPTYLGCINTRQGISNGYADIYTSDLDGQSLDLGEVPDGLYMLVVTTDYANRLFETNDLNNRTVVTLAVSDGGNTIEVVDRQWPVLGTEDDDTGTNLSPPGAPAQVSATAGNRTATVQWTPPTSDGGSAVTGYRVTSTPAAATLNVGAGARSVTVSNLTNGTTYTFSVQAANAVGHGPPTTSNAVTPGSSSPPTTAPTTTTTAPPPPPPPPPRGEQGYALLSADGDVLTFGAARNAGSLKSLGITPNKPPIGLAFTPSGDGYWIVAQDGGIFSFGDAKFHGSMGNARLNKPVLGMEPTPTGKGYWLFGADGGIFSFGDAQFRGSMGDKILAAPVIGMAATSTGKGYWLVAQDGGIFAFGDAKFHGSMGGHRLNQPVFDMAPTAADDGYWLVARDGGIFSFGAAASRFYGSAVNTAKDIVVGMGATPTGRGYWIADRSAAVHRFGDAAALGDARGRTTAVGFAALPRVPS